MGVAFNFRNVTLHPIKQNNKVTSAQLGTLVILTQQDIFKCIFLCHNNLPSLFENNSIFCKNP